MIARAKLNFLYRQQKLSMMQIANRLGTTHATVLYWLKKYQIQRRSWSESTYVKLNPKGDPFLIPSKLTAKQQALTHAALLLYWAEGRKQGSSIQLGNLDPRMLQLFLKFLREVCRVPVDRIRISARVYKAFPLDEARRYWTKTLQLPRSRVLVYRHTDGRSKFVKQWSRYGIATLQFHNIRFKEWLDRELAHCIAILLGRGSSLATPYPPVRVQLHLKFLRERPSVAWSYTAPGGDDDLQPWVMQDQRRNSL